LFKNPAKPAMLDATPRISRRPCPTALRVFPNNAIDSHSRYSISEETTFLLVARFLYPLVKRFGIKPRIDFEAAAPKRDL